MGPGSETTSVARESKLLVFDKSGKTNCDYLRESNDFVVPFLSVVGTLDGGGIMYAEREYFETQFMVGPFRNTSYFLVLEDVNHSQVRYLLKQLLS